MKRILLFLRNLIFGGIVLALTAEGISHFFLPAPVLPKLPMLKKAADPEVGYRLLPHQTGYTLDVLATTNQWGYRGKEWTVEKPQNTFRIAVLGASLTFGQGIEDQDIFTVKLENLLNESPPQAGMRYEVLNFGVNGYDIGHSVNVLKHDVLKFSPDLVLLSPFMGDVFYVKDYSFYPEFFRREEKNFSRFRWEIRNFFRHSRLAMFLWDQCKDHLWGIQPNEVNMMIQRYAIEGLSPLEGPNADGWRFISDRLKDYSEITRRNHIQAVFMLLPTHEEISNVNAKSTYAKYLQEKCALFGIHYLWFIKDVRENQKLVESFFIPYDFHFKKEGHAWVAALLAKQLTPLLKMGAK